MRKIILILLVLLIVALVVKFAIWTPADRESEEKRLRLLGLHKFSSELNLTGISRAIDFYIESTDNPDAVPPSTLEKLVEPELLISPMSGRDREKVTIDEYGVLSAPSDYVYIVLPRTAPDTLVQAYEKPENYKNSPWGEGTLVLFKQRQYRKPKVEWMDIKSLREALDQTNQWLTENNFEPGWTNLAESKKNIRLIGRAIAFFANMQNASPSSLEAIFKTMFVDMAGAGIPTPVDFVRALISPVSGRALLKIDKNSFPSESSDYVYIPLPKSAPSTLIQIYEKPENYKGSRWGEGTLVLFYPQDYEPGKIKWIDIKSFQAALKQTQNWLAENKK